MAFNSRKSLFAIDYDDTYTLDPSMWNKFIRDARKRGHKVVCATMRYPEDMDDGIRKLSKIVNKVVFTCKKAKKPYLQKMGIFPDVWMDDKPNYILKDKTTDVQNKK